VSTIREQRARAAISSSGIGSRLALRVQVADDQEVGAFNDAEAGTRLVNLLSSLTITPR
jgi:hypothetical protein